MRLVILLALLVLPQAYADDPYSRNVRGPEDAGDLYPAEHWRLQLIHSPCNEHCRETLTRTAPGFEHFSRTSCITRGIENMIGVLEVRGFLMEATTLVGFSCVYVFADD